MKQSITIQERLKDLRVGRHLNLEELAATTGISKSALGSYENDDYKEINHGSLVTLAKFYGVSTDYLLCLTENRNHPNTALTELHLSDSMIDLLKSGRISSDMPQTEVLNLNEELAKQLPATAYYNLYGYLDVGYGVRTEKDGKYAYLRKAADLGSREAQYTVAEMLADIEDSEETQEAFKYRLNLVKQLRSCASEQGLGEVSSNLGISLQMDKKYQEALKVFHQGVKNGDSISALVLSHAFESGVQADNLNFLDVSPDDERVKRYHMISSYLSRYDYLQPKVPDLDEIVPLPPAKLPKWDGKIAFQRWYEGEAPPKPSEALMQKLANQAGLRVDNGLDLETNLPKSVKK